MPASTRSTRKKARATEAVATDPLGALSHDELGVVFDGLADPLQPVGAVALSSTCLGLRTPLQPALAVLKEQHERAKRLCGFIKISCEEMHQLQTFDFALPDKEPALIYAVETLGMLMSRWLPRLNYLELEGQGIDDACMQALCAQLDVSSVPRLRLIDFCGNPIGPAGAKALAETLGRGALTSAAVLYFDYSEFGPEGLAELATPLRKLKNLRFLSLEGCGVGDDGVRSLLDGLGNNDLPVLRTLRLKSNNITQETRRWADSTAGHLPNLRRFLC